MPMTKKAPIPLTRLFEPNLSIPISSTIKVSFASSETSPDLSQP